jgi:hypothetical protein
MIPVPPYDNTEPPSRTNEANDREYWVWKFAGEIMGGQFSNHMNYEQVPNTDIKRATINVRVCVDFARALVAELEKEQR